MLRDFEKLGDVSPNTISDFDPAKFSILALCHTCNHQQVLDLYRLDPGLPIPDPRARLTLA